MTGQRVTKWREFVQSPRPARGFRVVTGAENGIFTNNPCRLSRLDVLLPPARNTSVLRIRPEPGETRDNMSHVWV